MSIWSTSIVALFCLWGQMNADNNKTYSYTWKSVTWLLPNLREKRWWPKNRRRTNHKISGNEIYIDQSATRWTSCIRLANRQRRSFIDRVVTHYPFSDIFNGYCINKQGWKGNGRAFITLKKSPHHRIT